MNNLFFTSICSCSLLMLVLAALPAEETALLDSSSTTNSFGKLTVTENLINQEILRLGGDWESGSKPKLVAFHGEKFESRHFEMMSHLPTVEFFFVHDGNAVDNFAIKCLSTIVSLKRLDFKRCEIDSTCLSLLDSNRDLRELNFEKIRFTNSVMNGVTQLNQVKTLTFAHIDLTDVAEDTINRIPQMRSLKKCNFRNCRGVSSERIEHMKTDFPDIDWK